MRVAPLPQGESSRPSTRARLIRRLVTAVLVVAVVAGMAFAGKSIFFTGTARRPVTAAHSRIMHSTAAHSVTTHSMKAGGRTRSWDEIRPTTPLPKSAPVIVVLSGVSEPLSAEIARDRLVPYVDAGKAELVYPAGYKDSWNAIGCCGKAAVARVDDVAFLKALAARVDPGHRRPLDIVGYSNGGRMAYRMACSDPGLFDQTAIVKADPMPGCDVTDSQTILQIAALDDTAVPYLPGKKGKESPPATVQVARLRAVDRCKQDEVSSQPGKTLRYTVWSDCADGTRVGFAVYSVGGHNFPPPTQTQPAAAAVIWAFFSHRSLVTSVSPD